MLHECRAAARSLARRPGLALTVVLTLMLGIGANSAIFSAVDAVLLKPLPYPAADRLVAVYELNMSQKGATQLVAPGRLEEWHRMNRSFEGLAGSYFENVTDTTGELPERVEAMNTSPRFFSVLGVSAALGRVTTAEEEVFGGRPVVVLSDAFWHKRFHGDPTAVGRALVLGGSSRTIVGVMPPSFRYPTANTEVWIPARSPAFLLAARQARFLTAVGRLKAGVTLEQAQDDLNNVQARLGEQYPQTDKGWGASLVPLKQEKVGGVRRSLWFLLSAVALVLLVACGNVACLMLADAARRDHEVAIRFALGADRRRVIAQLLTEGLLLAVVGAALGLIVAQWGLVSLRTAATQLPRINDVQLDLRLVAFTFALGFATTLLFAVAPALQATSRDPAAALARGGRSQAGGRHLMQRTLVSAQVALAIVLLVGAGLLIRSFMRLQDVSTGVRADHVLTFRMSAQWSERVDAVVGRQARTIARLQAIPGVDAAAFSQAVPAGSDFPPGEFHIIGRDDGEKTFANNRSVSAGYFRTLGIPILQGDTCGSEPTMRPPRAGDNPALRLMPSKALVTRAFADRFFPGENPLGRAVTTPNIPPGYESEIIGVVGDVRDRGLVSAPEPVLYWCGFSPYWPDPFFLVRLNEARPASMIAIRAALREIEPKRAMYAVNPLTELLSASVSQQRVNTILLVMFAATALALAAMGLYGVLSQLVLGRRREIGVRMALGARPAQILRSVISQAATVTAIGIAVGLAGALVLARFMATLVFGIPSRDPLTFVVVPIVLALVAVATAIVPARRASRVDPMHALRED